MSSTPRSTDSSPCPTPPMPVHVHHPNADHDVEFKGLAAYEKGGDVKPFAYNPPKLQADWVEVAITHCGICGTDCHIIDSDWRTSHYPVIPGHELVGTIVKRGPDVKHLQLGDRVGVGPRVYACFNKDGDCPECASGWEQSCRYSIRTYNTPWPDGQVSQGGYSNRIRLHSQFAFKIPDVISSAEAAPLLCAGVTTFAPLSRGLTRPGMKVGIIGIGGLGHLGVQFASKFHNGDVDVTAISSSSKKKEEALSMGAHHYLDMSDPAAVKDHERSFDFILCTADGSNMSYENWFSLIKFHGTFCVVGSPNTGISVNPFTLWRGGFTIAGSGVGSIQAIKEMLEFAAKHNIRPIIERLPMAQANEGLKKVRDGSVRFRVVLENSTTSSSM